MDGKRSLKKRFSETKFRSPFGGFYGEKVLVFLKTFANIIKAVISRSLYAVYTFVAVWRVTESLKDTSYWLLLFTITLLALELLHTVLARKGGELKWITPSVFFYLVCAVPPIWLLELKLLNDRLFGEQNMTTTNETNAASNTVNISIDLSEEGWVLALEQILIFVLVFGKWIAPKGELSRDELSQLLLVYLAAGADIIELLEIFAEDEVSNNAEIVYLILSIWSWSLLQFCIVPTAVKNIPTINNEQEEARQLQTKQSIDSNITVLTSVDEVKSNKTRSPSVTSARRMKAPFKRSFSEGNPDKQELNGIKMKRNKSSGANLGKNMQVIKVAPTSQSSTKLSNGTKKQRKNNMETIKDEEEPASTSSDNQRGNITARSVLIVEEYISAGDKEADPIYALTSGKRCCVCFCCYTEIWGMILSMMFQDVPFMITRIFVMAHYKVVSHMTVFFTCKNILIIILLLNRIRVIVLEERKEWRRLMTIVKRQRIDKSKFLQDKQKIKNLRKAEKSHDKKKEVIKIDVEPNNDVTTNNMQKPRRLKSTRWKFWRI